LDLLRPLKKLIPNRLKIYIRNIIPNKQINIKKLYPSYVPRGKGTTEQMKDIANKSINNIFPSLNFLSQSFLEKPFEIINIKEIELNDIEKKTAERLGKMFKKYGSDKSTKHNYHIVYGKLISNPEKILKILEIGLGTNNLDVLGTMGKDAEPGASIKAFKKICNNASIYGADIDERILFTEERITTEKVDQLSYESLNNLKQKFGNGFDLIIDDGLHAALANVNTLGVFLSQIKKEGFLVIEDIHETTLPIWELIYKIIPVDKYDANMYIDKSSSYIFTIQKT